MLMQSETHTNIFIENYLCILYVRLLRSLGAVIISDHFNAVELCLSLILWFLQYYSDD